MSNPQFTPIIGAENIRHPSAEGNIRELVAMALKRCSKIKSREQVVLALNMLTQAGITKRMLDDWASPSKKGLRFPASLIKAFCQVTGDDGLQLHVLTDANRGFLELGKRASQMNWVIQKLMQEADSLIKAHGGDLGLPKKRRAAKPKKRARKRRRR
jgi:hypothetical protein